MNLKITVYTIKFSFFLCIEKSFPFYWQKLSFSLLIEIHVDDEVHLKGGSVMQAKQIDSDECIIQM